MWKDPEKEKPDTTRDVLVWNDLGYDVAYWDAFMGEWYYTKAEGFRIYPDFWRELPPSPEDTQKQREFAFAMEASDE